MLFHQSKSLQLKSCNRTVRRIAGIVPAALSVCLLMGYASQGIARAPYEAAAFDRKITGRVTDGTGGGLPGVTIALKGASTGTVTDVNGEYSLNVPDTGAVLIFRFVGYNTQEVAVGSQARVDVVMTTSAKGLNELVVVGYGTQKKVNLTGAVTAVRAEELVNLAPSNLSNALAGRSRCKRDERLRYGGRLFQHPHPRRIRRSAVRDRRDRSR
ncbi:carboxypeptidase-like regulatory domain-containing protein [Chitinophaga sp.]|uniref:carboxypeptidase-like regulatory domain-containing protein n=1 Tax=Chitinophaga sp. TaxID=1869181 RepID=UPI0026176958|nr:carboxypeptidase-like regulatory domain-containing protein [uncultured Chitinophaga sp.]